MKPAVGGMPAITLGTRVDGIYVELDDNVQLYNDPRDLLMIRKLTMEAHTPSGFLASTDIIDDIFRPSNPFFLPMAIFWTRVNLKLSLCQKGVLLRSFGRLRQPRIYHSHKLFEALLCYSYALIVAITAL